MISKLTLEKKIKPTDDSDLDVKLLPAACVLQLYSVRPCVPTPRAPYLELGNSLHIVDVRLPHLKSVPRPFYRGSWTRLNVLNVEYI